MEMKRLAYIILAVFMLTSCEIEGPRRNSLDILSLYRAMTEEMEFGINYDISQLYATLMIEEYKDLNGNSLPDDVKSFMEYTYRVEESGRYVHTSSGYIQTDLWHKSDVNTYDMQGMLAVDLGKGEGRKRMLQVSIDTSYKKENSTRYNTTAGFKSIGKLIYEFVPSGHFQMSGTIHCSFYSNGQEEDWIELTYKDGKPVSVTSSQEGTIGFLD